jgi:signal peptidase I
MPITINTSQPRPPKKEATELASNKWLTWLIEAAIILLAVVVVVIVRVKIYNVSIVISRSMEPTLHVGDRLVFDHRASIQGQWKRGDIVFFEPPSTWQDAEGDLLVKRIIALPNETISIRAGHVYVDNQEIKAGMVEDADDNLVPRRLGTDEYFVIGDNRSNSDDSRNHGPIRKGDIRGRAVYRLWPSPGALPSQP